MRPQPRRAAPTSAPAWGRLGAVAAAWMRRPEVPDPPRWWCAASPGQLQPRPSSTTPVGCEKLVQSLGARGERYGQVVTTIGSVADVRRRSPPNAGWRFRTLHAAPAASSRPTETTRASSRAKCCAQARPIPIVPPLIRATFPAKRPIASPFARRRMAYAVAVVEMNVSSTPASAAAARSRIWLPISAVAGRVSPVAPLRVSTW